MQWAVAIGAIVFALARCGSGGRPASAREFSWKVQGDDFAFSTAVTRVPAGPVRLVLENAGVEEHQASLVRLPPGVKPLDLVLTAFRDRSGGTFFPKVEGWGGPAVVPRGDADFTRQVLRPGPYVLMCLIRSLDGVSHAEKGMILPFTVVGREPRPETATSSPSAKVVLRNFGFDGPPSFRANALTSVENGGSEPHELVAYELADGRTPDDVRAFLQTYPSGAEPPMTGAGGVAFLSPGRRSLMEVPKAGSYAFVCFLPTEEGVPHFRLGMVAFVDVQ